MSFFSSKLNSQSESRVAFVGWHEGSAGQIHSWFEEANLGKIAFFIHPEDDPPEIKKISRAVSQFSYPENGKFKNVPLICKKNWPEFLVQNKVDKVLVTISDPAERWAEMKKAYDSGLELINAIHPSTLLLKECLLGKTLSYILDQRLVIEPKLMMESLLISERRSIIIVRSKRLLQLIQELLLRGMF